MQNATLDLFGTDAPHHQTQEILAAGATLLRGFALPFDAELLIAIKLIIATSPIRYMFTPGGLRMSVAMSNCGKLGWISDHRGYRYVSNDPLTDAPWPAMPEVFSRLAQSAATAAGFSHFIPDACLINRYEPGTRLSLHQDKNERDFSAPIVSVSLGLPAVFLLGGAERSDTQQRIPLQHGDVVVWGGPVRLNYHGVLPLKTGFHDLFGAERINLTFRQAG
jgi:alkylated DNA repair protein (DNA oxidative demethylase)